MTVELYDCTLRDGLGGPGLSLTADEQVRVVHKLDELGIDLIEAGFENSNPKEASLFSLLANERLGHAQLVAFGMTRRRGIAAEADENLRVLARSIAPVCTLVGKSSPLHVDKVLRVSRDENLAMITESLAFLRLQGKRAIFDAEHFFDGWRADPDYALLTLRAAVEGGAERVVLCDTNGSSLPSQIRSAVSAVVAALPDVPLGIHCHNDAGCGVANSLEAVEAGVTQVQGTMNGIGERTGNANLVSIIPALQLKMGRPVVSSEQLTSLTGAAHFVDELLNRPPDPSQPYVGRNAFAHKAGLHGAAVRAHPSTFEHVQPEVVGNRNELVVSELAGRGMVMERARGAGIDLDEAGAARVLREVKDREHRGYQFDAADGSFELLMRREAGDFQPLFVVESWKVTVDHRAEGRIETDATVKIFVNGERKVAHAEGNGPLNALDAALRSAIGDHYPHVRDIELTDFKVRILDESKGTAAITRVLLEAWDHHDTWTSIGVGPNVVEASWDALVESLEVAMHRSPIPSR